VGCDFQAETLAEACDRLAQRLGAQGGHFSVVAQHPAFRLTAQNLSHDFAVTLDQAETELPEDDRAYPIFRLRRSGILTTIARRPLTLDGDGVGAGVEIVPLHTAQLAPSRPGQPFHGDGHCQHQIAIRPVLSRCRRCGHHLRDVGQRGALRFGSSHPGAVAPLAGLSAIHCHIAACSRELGSQDGVRLANGVGGDVLGKVAVQVVQIMSRQLLEGK
jgi:hypothetical protein